MLMKPEHTENGLCYVVGALYLCILAFLLYIYEYIANVLVVVCKLNLPKVNGMCGASPALLRNVNSCSPAVV